jgi:hypothetical protein
MGLEKGAAVVRAERKGALLSALFIFWVVWGREDLGNV